MIGNDVVDLALAQKQSNWKRPGFLEKTMTGQERAFIANADNPAHWVWLFWSMKETAYKAWNRETGIRAFNPARFDCRLTDTGLDFAEGNVSIDRNRYECWSIWNEDGIRTFGKKHDFNIDLYQYDVVTKDRFEHQNYIVRDRDGRPVFGHKKNETALISASQHGRLCSYLSTIPLF